MMMRKFLDKHLLLALACTVFCAIAFGLSLAGVDNQTTTRTITTPSSAQCTPAAAVMGCASGAQAIPTPPPPNTRPKVTAPVRGCIYPDVSYAQGYISYARWAEASKYICAAVVKAGEYVMDSQFEHNVAVLRALHIPWGAYLFVRNCTSGANLVAWLNAVHYKGDRDALVPDLDMEVPSAYNCAVPLANAVHRAFGVWPDIYSAPGTWPGGSTGGLDFWEADYTTATRPEPFSFTATVVGWQRYSPPYLDREIPGLGYLDVSIDTGGFSKQFAFPAPKPVTHTTTTPPPPPPSARAVCFGSGARQGATCIAVRRRYAWLTSREGFWQHEFNRCIRYADGIGCDRAWHWYRVRSGDARKLRSRFS
jgi:GH25 family lysozyme M1 (1,4-beta-N-acetylmuramidase)